MHTFGSYRSALGKQRLPLVRSALRENKGRHSQSDRLDLAIMDRLQLTHENHNKIRRPYCGFFCMRLSELIRTRSSFAPHVTKRQVVKGAR